MHPTSKEFREKVEDLYGFTPEIKEFGSGTKTAQDAADSIGCELGQIVKSLLMKSGEDYFLVLCSGENSVETEEMADVLGVESVDTASPSEVKEVTGWSIGGVPPLLEEELEVFIDPDLMEFEEVWAAAGTPEAVFSISPGSLKDTADAREVSFFR